MYADILLPVDLNHASSWSRALPVAVALCQACGARLHVLTVVPSLGMPIVGSYFPDDFEARMRAETDTQLHAFVAAHVPADVAVQHIVEEGTVYDRILATADKIGADLIVIAAHRPELQDYLIGPNAARVVRHAGCSVLVVRGG